MTARGIILYGPPASGKDTVTAALSDADQRIRIFHRLKAGGGRTSGYRVVDDGYIDDQVEAGHIAWANRRYGARYAIDTPALAVAVTEGVPVLHLGQLAALPAVKCATPEGASFWEAC